MSNSFGLGIHVGGETEDAFVINVPWDDDKHRFSPAFRIDGNVITTRDPQTPVLTFEDGLWWTPEHDVGYRTLVVETYDWTDNV